MVQMTESTINLNHLQLERQEVEAVLECWKPEALVQVSLKRDMSIYYLQSVNPHTEFVTVRGEDEIIEVISFKELKDKYIPVFTGENLQKVVEQLPKECSSLKEKLSGCINREAVYKQ